MEFPELAWRSLEEIRVRKSSNSFFFFFLTQVEVILAEFT